MIYQLTLKSYNDYNNLWDSPNLEYRLFKFSLKWYLLHDEAIKYHRDEHIPNAGRFMKEVRR